MKILSAEACGRSNAAFTLLPGNIWLGASCGCANISLEYPQIQVHCMCVQMKGNGIEVNDDALCVQV